LLGLLLQRSTVPAILGNFEFSLLKDVQLSLEYFHSVRGCLVFLFPIGLNIAAILPTGNLKKKNCCWSITRRERHTHFIGVILLCLKYALVFLLFMLQA
jgi:hypothetical protein